MKDIQTRDDIMLLVDSFYEKAKKSELIGYIFNDVAQVNWEVHLPVMYDFWETILLNSNSFKGNPMDKHIALAQKTPLKEAHFAEWKKLWFETVDEHFLGTKANEAKQRATSIAELMQFKINQQQ